MAGIELCTVDSTTAETGSSQNTQLFSSKLFASLVDANQLIMLTVCTCTVLVLSRMYLQVEERLVVLLPVLVQETASLRMWSHGKGRSRLRTVHILCWNIAISE